MNQALINRTLIGFVPETPHFRMLQDPSVKNGELVPGKSRNLIKPQKLKLTQAEATKMQVMPCTPVDMDYYCQRERTHILSRLILRNTAIGTLRGRDLPCPGLTARDNTAKSKLKAQLQPAVHQAGYQRTSKYTQAPPHGASDSSMFEPTNRMRGTGTRRLESQNPTAERPLHQGTHSSADLQGMSYSSSNHCAFLIHRDSSHYKPHSAHSHSEQMARPQSDLTPYLLLLLLSEFANSALKNEQFVMITHSSESCTEWQLKQSPLLLPTGRDLWEEPGLALSPPLPPPECETRHRSWAEQQRYLTISSDHLQLFCSKT